MKKNVFICLTLLFTQLTFVRAQVNDMLFANASGTYTVITGGTVLGDVSSDDQLFVDPAAPLGGYTATGVGLPIGFTFHFNGYDFDKFAVNANGWISLGTSSLTPSVDITSTSNYTPLSSTSTNTPAYLRSRIAALGRDIQSQTGGEIRYQTIGTAPDRVLVVQWKNYRKYSATGDNFNFQIRLYETTNVVEIVYGTMTNNATSTTVQVGLGGSAATDFNNRTTTSNWSATSVGSTNADACTLSSTVYPVSGKTFRWTPSTCPAPAALTISNVTSSSADLSWTSTASEFQLEYGLQGFTFGTGTRISGINTTNYSFTGLSSNTNYQVYVRAICGVGDTSSWVSVPFVTPCVAIATLPWNENFDAVTIPNLPSCWYKENGSWVVTDNSNTTYDADAHSGTQFLRETYGVTNEYVWTPGFTLTAGTSYDFSFWWAGDNYAGWTGDVFYNTNQLSTGATQLGTSFVTSATTTTTTYQKQKYTFVPATTGTYYFAVRVNADYSPEYLSFDDFSVELTPSCPEPGILTASNVGSTSATLQWTAGGSETLWNIEYGPAGFTQGTGTVITGVTNPYVLTGLNPVTAYSYYVQADCGGGDQSIWSFPKTFTTTQIPATLPYFIDFESGTEQWAVLNGTAANKWYDGTATAYSGTHSEYISDDNGVSNHYNTSSTSVVHFYRDVTFPNTTNPMMLEFAWKGYGESSYYDFLKVYMIPTSQIPVVGTQLTATQLGSTYNLQNSWQQVSLQLPDTLAGKTKRFVFSWYNDGSVGTQPPIAVDDIRFYVLTCPKPTNLAANTITQNSAVLTWTAGGSEPQWQLQWGNAGFSLGNGTVVNNLSAATYNLTGLTAASSYSFYVRGICGAGDTSMWAGPYNFSTACGPVTATYIQNFDGVTPPVLPNCWSSIVMSSGGTPNVQTTTTSPSTAPNCAQLYNSTASGSTTHILLITPQLSDLPSHTTEITFKAKFTGTGTPVLYVGTMTDPTNPGTFSSFQTIITLTSDWQEFTVAFNTYVGSNQYIAFKHGLGMTNQYIYIDDVSYEPIPTCPKPHNLTVSNITGTGATLSWTAGGAEPSWDIEYGPAGFTHGTGTLIQNVNASTYNLIGLNPSTAYQAYVLAQCSSSDSSFWLGPASFTTTQIPATLPYVWNFENDFNGWSVVNGSQTNKWFTGTAAFSSPTKGAYISNTNGTTNNYDGTVTSVAHIYRDIQFPVGTEFAMIFKWKALGESSYDYMRIFSESTTFVPVEGVLPTANQIGKQYYNLNNTWHNDTILFDNSVSNSIKRLIFTWRNDASGTYQSPIAIDDIDIFAITCPNPVSLTATNLTSSSADLGWTSQGSEAQWQVQYGLQGFTLGAGTSQLASTNPVNITGLSSGMYYSFYVRAICGVGDTSFWAGPYTFYIPCNATTATYTQNFDGVTTPNLPLCWTEKIVASTTSAVVQTSTSSPNSSPNCAYLYNYNAQGAATHILLISPPFSDLSSHLNRIRFNLKGSTTEKLIVGTMSNPNNETTFVPFDTIVIPSSTVWTQEIVSFLNYQGTNEYIAFKHATVSTYTSIYIDDFVYEPLPTVDLAVTQITQPSTGCGLTNAESITIKVKNLAVNAFANIPVAYKINNGVAIGPETINVTLNPGDSMLYTFNATADLSLPGSYTIKAYIAETTDQDHSNDTTSRQIISSPLITSFPYIDDFEVNNGYWVAGGVNSSWQWGTPAGTTINTAASGTKAWVTNLTGYYNNSENSYVVGPCFDFSSLANPYVKLKRFVNAENSYDGAVLQYSLNGGNTWQNVGALNDQTNWYNDNTISGLQFSGSQEGWTGVQTSWVGSSHSLPGLAHQPSVKFRVVFGSDGSDNSYDGFAFDDFIVFEPADVAIVSPADNATFHKCGLTNHEPLSIWIKNVGTTTIPSGEIIRTWYKVDANTPVADTLTLTANFLPNDSIQYTYPQHYDFSALTTYVVNYWIHFGADYNLSNDTILTTLVNFNLTVNISGGDTVCVDPIYMPYTLTLQSSSYTYDSYSWSNASGSSTGHNSFFDAHSFGWYYVTVTNGSCSATDSIFVCDITKIPSLANTTINVYPSPATVQLNITASSLPVGDYMLKLTTVDGKVIVQKAFVKTNVINTVIQTAQLAEGIYVLSITNSQQTWKFKVVR